MKRFSSIFKIVLALTLVISTLSLAGCKRQEDDDTFVIGMECNYAPFNWTQDNDANGAVPIDGLAGSYAGGYDVQIAKKIAQDMGKELVIKKIDWDGLIPALTSGAIDGIIAGMSPTAERKETIDFSENYYRSELVLVVLKDGAYSSAASLQDFSGAKVVGQQGTFHDTVIDQIPSVNHVTAIGTFPLMIVALQAGTVDAYVSELPGAKSAAAANDDLAYIEFDEGKGFTYSDDDAAIAVGLKKNSALTSKVNEAVAKISEDDRADLMEQALANQPQ